MSKLNQSPENINILCFSDTNKNMSIKQQMICWQHFMYVNNDLYAMLDLKMKASKFSFKTNFKIRVMLDIIHENFPLITNNLYTFPINKLVLIFYLFFVDASKSYHNFLSSEKLNTRIWGKWVTESDVCDFLIDWDRMWQVFEDPWMNLDQILVLYFKESGI